MVFGMATTQKITVTVPTESVAAIRGLVSEGRADSVSGFVQHAIRVALDDVTGWGAMLGQALDATGGEMTAEERAWADRVLGTVGSDPGTAA